ncbi:PAS domain S-box protein [Confluentibacter lentus]|uniref:PAS domain S-box protein n=1 Tax=Confluentibacter lentus TaxID=1699412 RepID=UPI000C292A2E|nr:PAS domain S-box protein [Confluentibacter lentus]
MSNRQDYSTLFYLNPFPHWVYDIGTFEILDVNQATIDLYGYSKEEFLALTIKDLRPKEEIPKVIAVHEGIDTHVGNKHFGTFTHQKKDGTIFRVETNGHRVEFQGKSCFMIVGQDVTDKEKLFRQSQEAMHIMNASLDVICSIDENGIFISVSHAAVDVWGYQPEELVGKAYLELVYEEDLELTRQVAIDIMSGKAVTTFENRYIKKNGNIAYNIWSARWDSETKIMYAIARNANEKRKADQVLAESEKRFKALVQEGSDLIAILDIEGNYKYVSPTSIAILGFTPEEFLGKSPFEFIHPEDIENTMQSLGKIATENRVAVQPFRFKNKDGQWHWIETVLTNMLEHPSIQGIVANSRDITEKRNEEQHSKLLQSVITHTNDAVLITEAEPQDEPGPRIIYVNEAFTKMTGYTAEEVIGKSPRLLQGPKTDKKELARLGKALRNWQPCEVTTLNYKKNGEEFWINFTVSPVADETGWYTHWIAIERDVTAAKNEQFKNDFLNNISTVFNDGIDLNMSLERLCELIANYGDFSFCEIWLPTIHQKALKLLSRIEMDATAKKFYIESEDIDEIGFDKGLPGKVWKSKESIIWQDSDIETFFIRNDAAKKAGLKSVLGIPLTHQEKIVGVMVVGTKEDVDKMEHFQSMLTEMESFIGSKINRKRLESDLHHLFDTLPDIICIADSKGHFLKINKAGCELLGYEEHEIVGYPFEKFTHPLDKTIYSNEIKKGDSILNFENRYITKKNDTIWLNWHCNSIKEEGVIYATAKNITEEKKLRELLVDASQLAKIGSWELDLLSKDETDTLYWSPMVKKIMEVDSNYNPSFTGGREFYKPESKDRIEKVVEVLIKGGSGFDEELQIVTKRGKEKWIRIIAKGEHVNGVCTKIFGSIQDINAMKTTEFQLKEILGSISDGFYALDEHWNFTYFNKEAENLLNRKSSEVLGKSIWEGLSHLKGTELERVYKKVAKSRKPISIEYLSPKYGNWFEINVYPSVGGISVYFKNIDERINTAEKLQNAYQEKIKIIESIGDAFFTMDRDFTVTYWNKTAEKLLGFKRESLLGKNLWSVFPTAVNLPSYANYHKVMETGEPIMFEDYYGVWLEVNAYPSADGISVFFRDITHRKEADDRLLKAYDEKNQILESIGDAFFAVDKDWTVTYWNKEAENILGRKRDVILGKNLWEEYADAVESDFYRQYHLAVSTAKMVSFEEYYSTLGKWFEVTAYPNSNGLSVYFKDVTLRKETDIRILQANERFEKVTKATTDAIWDWDIENDVFYRGDGFEKLFGYEVKKTLTGEVFWQDSFHPEDLPKIQASLHECLQDSAMDLWRQEYRIIRKGGEEKTVIDKGVVIRNEEGKAIRMVGAITDITHRVVYEKEVIELNKMLKKHIKELEISNEELEQFAFIASHDLQEPLRMISSFLNQIQRKYGDQLDDKAHQYINFATDGAKRMKQIILDLLDYSKAGKLAENLERIKLNELIDEYGILRRRLIQEKGATIIVNNLPNVTCYKAPLLQTLHCLLDNAIKYSRENVPPVIKISALETDTYWQISIEDNGIGIDAQFFDKIFIIFQRLHNRDRYEGTGIGLSIAKKHIEYWGGKIWVESELDKGSAFYFTINKDVDK